MKIMFLLVIFVIAVYVYTYIKHRKIREKTQKINTVNEFRKRYEKSKTRKSGTNNEDKNYTKYLTKYNSSIDFVDKEEFIRDALEENEQNNWSRFT